MEKRRAKSPALAGKRQQNHYSTALLSDENYSLAGKKEDGAEEKGLFAFA